MCKSNEIDIIKQASKGSIPAFEEIVNTYKDRVVNICYSYTNNAHDAEDVAQEVFIDMHSSIKSFAFKSKFSTWIYRLASNKSIDYLRKQKRVKRGGGMLSYLNDESYQNISDSNSNTPISQMVKEQQKELLYSGLDKLATRQKEAFVLIQVEGMSYKEAAEIMDTTVKSAELLVVRAKKKLRKIFEKHINNYL